MSTNDIKINKIQSSGLLFAKKSDDLTWNDPSIRGNSLQYTYPFNFHFVSNCHLVFPALVPSKYV